jgi:phage-related minor tail protein
MTDDYSRLITEHTKLLAELTVLTKQHDESINSLEARTEEMGKVIVRLETSLVGVNNAVAALSDRVCDLKNGILKVLFYVVIALIVVAVGSKTAEVFKMVGGL